MVPQQSFPAQPTQQPADQTQQAQMMGPPAYSTLSPAESAPRYEQLTNQAVGPIPNKF